MSLSSIDLWQKIAAEGIASTMLCRSWASEVAEALPAEHTQDGIRVLRQLIKSGRLTEYQAKILAGRSQKPLRNGPWHILQPVEHSLWSGWLEVAKIDNGNANALDPKWSIWLDSEALNALEPSLPSLPRAIQLAGVRVTNLQQVEIPVLADGKLQLQVQPVNGRTLSSFVASHSLKQDQIQSLVLQIAGALSALHEQGLEHGRVLPDRIFWDGTNATLLVDPIAAHTATLDKNARGVLAEELGELRKEHFLAPEFVTPGQAATMASDVFALGCVWWWLLTGTLPADGVDTQSILTSQAEPLASLPAQVTLPEPSQRVLMHCLARNIGARFSSASALCHALEAARAVIQNGKQPVSQARAVDASPPLPQPATKESKSQQGVAKAIPQAPTVRTSSPAPQDAPSESQSSRNPKSPAQTKSPQTKSAQPKSAQPKSVQPVTTAASAVPEKTSAQKPTAKPIQTAAEPEPAKENPAASKSREPSADAAPTSAKAPTAARATAENTPTSSEPTATNAPSAKPSVGTPTKQRAATAVQPSATTPTATKVRKRRKRGSNKWMLPVFGGGGFLVIMLLVLKLSGALDWSAQKEEVAERPAYVPPSVSEPELVDRDPRLDRFRIVESSGKELWAPPSIGDPIPRDLLPPGGQCFVTFSPANWMTAEENRDLLATFAEQTEGLLELLSQRAGSPIDDIDLITIAFFDAPTDGEFPLWSARVRLATPMPLSELKAQWNADQEVQIGGVTLLAGSAQANNMEWAYFVSSQPLTDSLSVDQFSFGPLTLMREAAELEGAEGPLISQMESLWEVTNSNLDLSILISPPYLFSEGRGMLQSFPKRLQMHLREVLGQNARAALVQMDLASRWYYELQVIGSAPPDSARILASVESKVRELPAVVENWFVDETPDPYWRALALRYPQMLRASAENSRFGVENGVAITNTYLPSSSAANLLLANYIALQETATLATAGSGQNTTPVTKPLTTDEYLGRSIRLSFAQEPIEVALKLTGDEANDQLPSGTPSMRFELDGDAFELSGITRNFQLRDFEMRDRPVRDVLTEIARRGNPTPNVTDLKLEDQKLIWVVRDDPNTPGVPMISLTTRDAATKAQIPLPAEFAP